MIDYIKLQIIIQLCLHASLLIFWLMEKINLS